MKVYKRTRVDKLVTAFSMSLTYVLLMAIFINATATFFPPIALLSGGLLILVVLVFFCINSATHSIIIDKNSICSKSILSTKMLTFDEIAGYEYNSKSIALIPINKKKKKIVITLYQQGYIELQKWVSKNFIDSKAQAEKELLENPKYGATAKERSSNLKQAQQRINIINMISFMLVLLSFVSPLRNFAVCLLLFMPWIAGVMAYYLRAKVRVGIDIYTSTPSIILTVALAAIVPLVMNSMSFKIFSYQNIWLPAITIAVVLSIFLIIIAKPFDSNWKFNYLVIVMLAALTFGYGSGSVTFLNYMADKSIPIYYKAEVLDKSILYSKTTSYNLTIAPWGPQQQLSQETVSARFYDSIRKSDFLVIHYGKGAFNIPWYKVKGKERVRYMPPR